MKRTVVILVCILSIFSCKKQSSSGHSCYVDYATVVGQWKLSAINNYSVPRNYTNWQPVLTNQQAIIEFTADSLFTYDDLFSWKGDGLDRLKKSGNYLTITSNSAVFPITVALTNPNELILTHNEIDAGQAQKFERYCSQ